jgi:predicted RNA-binding protein associated with RNAse of E/G family
MEIRLIKPLKGVTIRYAAEELRRDATSITVQARWTLPAVDVGLLRFEPDDVLIEHYYADRWYNIFELYASDGRFKGWYCNVTRPAVIADSYVESEDLELDLIVAPDRGSTRLDDEDEFAARNLERAEPVAYRAALAAVEELRALVAAGAGPFAEKSLVCR